MVKEVADYVDEVQKRFPFMTKSEINKILTFGLKRYARANKQHCDISIIKHEPEESFCSQTGFLGLDKLKAYWRFLTKNRMKERFIDRSKKNKWDGYYYIGLTEEQHEKVKSQRGKYKIFESIYLTRLKRELYHAPRVKYIWRVPWIMNCGYRFFKEELKTNKAEYVGKNQYGKYHQQFQRGIDAGCESINQ